MYDSAYVRTEHTRVLRNQCRTVLILAY